MDKLQNEIEKLKKELNDYIEANYISKITVCRGRLLRKTKKLISILEKKENKTAEEIALLEKCNSELAAEAMRHKMQLKSRYNNEFIRAEAKVPDIIATLPKALVLQCKRISNAILEIKLAKTTKARIKAILRAGKELSLFVATPAVFAGKFVCEHWYLVMLLLRLLPNIKLGKNGNSSSLSNNGLAQEVPVTINLPTEVVDDAQLTVTSPHKTIPNEIILPHRVKGKIGTSKLPGSIQRIPGKTTPGIAPKNIPVFESKIMPSLMKSLSNSSGSIINSLVNADVNIQGVVTEFYNNFINYLQNTSGIVIGSSSGYTIVNSVKDVENALRGTSYAHLINEKLSTDPASWYRDNSWTLSYANIWWPEYERQNGAVYYADMQEVISHLVHGDDPILNGAYQKFISNAENATLLASIGKFLSSSGKATGKFLSENGPTVLLVGTVLAAGLVLGPEVAIALAPVIARGVA